MAETTRRSLKSAKSSSRLLGRIDWRRVENR